MSGIVKIERVPGVNETLYNVTTLVPGSDASIDIAKQIITTVSTLVVAVAGFYFGVKSVSTAKEAVGRVSKPIEEVKDPLATLKMRLAKGDIKKDEYEETKAVITKES